MGSKSERDRPNFKRMFDAASRREFDLVLFCALDRFSREGVLPTLHHLQRLDGYGVAWRSYTEQYLDSTGVFKDAVISIMTTHRQAGKHPQVGARQGGTGACQTPRF